MPSLSGFSRIDRFMTQRQACFTGMEPAAGAVLLGWRAIPQQNSAGFDECLRVFFSSGGWKVSVPSEGK
jgi:hypothetical protein